MDEEIKEKIRIQGHKIKSLSLTRSLIQQHRRACFPYVFPPVDVEKLNLAWWKAKHEMVSKREERTKPSSGCFIMIIYFFPLSPLLFPFYAAFCSSYDADIAVVDSFS